MSAGLIEPRTAMWAKAEISWEEAGGAPVVSSAVIEDTSPSGACLRVPKPISVGAKLTVKWRKEHFRAIARNCRSDGAEFLLGVQRDHSAAALGGCRTGVPAAPFATDKERKAKKESSPASPPIADLKTDGPEVPLSRPVKAPPTTEREYGALSALQGMHAKSSDHERTVMESKNMFPKFWRREQASANGPQSPASAAVAAAAPQSQSVERLPGPKGDLLSYEDIYRAAGILRPSSGYDIGKVVDMLHSDRIRALPDEAKRASVLMAIEAAGASPDDLLRDATERKHALESYEAAQQKQLEQFESRKSQENGQIEAEMARVAARYAERIKANLDQVASERETLRNWQMAKQHEGQRITEVIELCTKSADPQAAMAPSGNALSSSPRATSAPSLVAGMVTSRPN